LIAYPQFWTTKCQTWCFQLCEAFEARNKVSVFLYYLHHLVKVNKNDPQINADIGYLKQVVGVLQQLHQITEKIYSTDEWKSSVKVHEAF
jgi:hypothetical protein